MERPFCLRIRRVIDSVNYRTQSERERSQCIRLVAVAVDLLPLFLRVLELSSCAPYDLRRLPFYSTSYLPRFFASGKSAQPAP